MLIDTPGGPMSFSLNNIIREVPKVFFAARNVSQKVALNASVQCEQCDISV